MGDRSNSNVKFIYWFAFYNKDSPSVRYRGQYPLEFLKKNYSISSYFIIPGYSPINIIRFLRAYLSALFFRKPDSLIVVQKVNSNFLYSTLLKLLIRVRNTNTFYDLDDADYLEHPPETIYYFIRHCSAVIAGSRELLNNLSALNQKIILNTSPTPDLKIVKTNKNKTLTIGWIGGFCGGHKKSMVELFFPSLKDLPFKVKLVLLGVYDDRENDFLHSFFKSNPNVELNIPNDIVWTNENEIQERISNFDVGIATLLDDELHRSKSAFKMKQYFNNAVPVLSSDIAENNFFLNDGRNGYLCLTPMDFRKRLIELNEMSQSSYMHLSQQARSSIKDFNLENYCETLINIV